MKLYLSSHRIGREPHTMLTASASNARVAVIQNAQDCWTDSATRRSVLDRECADLISIGLQPVEVDLRRFFGRQSELERDLRDYSYCWVCGGNSLVLRRALRSSGLDEILRKLAGQEEVLTYGGYSAGICVLTPTLEGIH